MIDPAAPKHAKRLITVPAEAKVLRDAVTDVLDRASQCARSPPTCASAACKRDDLARLLSEDVLTEAGVRQERKRIDARLAQISTDLADATQIDLLPELRAPGADPGRVWKELSLPRQREIVRLLCDVTLLPGRMRQPFDPRLQMRIEWRQ